LSGGNWRWREGGFVCKFTNEKEAECLTRKVTENARRD
jgi:hypothetical protein